MSIQPYVGPGVGGSETALIAFGGQELSQAELEKRQKDVSTRFCLRTCVALRNLLTASALLSTVLSCRRRSLRRS